MPTRARLGWGGALRGTPAVVVGVYLVVFAGELPFQAIFPLLPTLAHSLALSKVQTSALVAAPAAGVLASSLPAAALAERFGARAIVLGAGLGLVLTSLVQALPGDFWTLLAARIGLGFAHAGIWVAAPMLIAEATHGARRVAAIAANMPVAAFGAIIAPAMGGFIGERYGVRAPFALAAGFALLVCAAFFVLARRNPPPSTLRERSTHATAPALRSLAFPGVRAAVVFTLLAALVGNVVNFLVALRLGANGLSPSAIGLVFAAAAAVLLAASLAVVLAGARLVRVGVGVATALLLAASMVIVVISHSTGPVVGFAFSRAFCVAVLYTIAYPIATGVGGRGTAAALGLVSAAWGIGALCGPLAAGALAASIGERSTYAVFLVVTLVFAGGTMADRLRNRRTPLIVVSLEGR
jgi:predicted MFS family arabinose efflux permease